MTKFKAVVVMVKCEHCGCENRKLIPLEIGEADWWRSQESMGSDS